MSILAKWRHWEFQEGRQLTPTVQSLIGLAAMACDLKNVCLYLLFVYGLVFIICLYIKEQKQVIVFRTDIN